MKTTNTTIMKIAALAAICCTAACSTNTTASSDNTAGRANKTPEIARQVEVKPEANTAQQSKATETQPIKIDESPAVSPGTPTAVYKTAYAARKNKDIPTLKRLMSKDALEFMSIFIEPGQTIDDALQQMTQRPQAATDESRNEKITGDKATIEYPDENGKWKTMDFVKEDGAWKITMPKADSPGAGKMNKSK